MPRGHVAGYNVHYGAPEAAKRYHSIIVKVAAKDQVAAVAKAIEVMDLEVTDSGAEQAGMLITVFVLVFSLLSTIIVGIAAINIMHVFFMLVYERQREIGIMRAVGAQGMVSGQFLDMLSGDANTYRLHRLKTGRLIEAALMMPLMQKNNKPNLAQIRWARGLGLLFQITDDLLDTTADTQALGKTAGKDAAQHKKTIVALLGLAAAKQKALIITQRLEQTAPQIFPQSELLKQLPAFLLQRQS